MPRFKNTFIKGIDQDTSANSRDPQTYYYAENIRVLLSEQLASGAITNIKGTTNLDLESHLSNACLAKGISPSLVHTIVGVGSVRDTLILFTVSNNSSFIFGLTLTKEEITSSTLYYSDISTVDGSKLNLSTNYPIRAFTAHYENEDNIKIYFSDFRADTTFNPLRSMNIAQADLMTGVQGISANSFNIIPEFTPSTPTIISVESGGDLKNGLIQYAYQLYNKYGSKSIISPLSNLVHLAPTNYVAANTQEYIGGLVEESSGKAVNISIDIEDSTYDRIRVFAIHYTTEAGVPSIHVLEDTDSNDSIRLTDSGNNYIDTLSLEEFVSLPDYFTAKDLAVKDNILFASNIKTQNFDFDFDARAYRFPKDAYTTKVEAADSTYISLGATPDPSATAHYTWNNVTDIPEEYDAINPYNDYTTSIPTMETAYFYKRGSDRFGGSGWNVSYEFELEDIIIDESSSGDTVYTVGAKGYEDYAKVSFRDWQRDEIYRFGLVGFNSKMQPSPVKWIGDIRIPAHIDSDSSYTYNAIDSSGTPFTSNFKTLNKRLSIEFTINTNNLPDEVKHYQIVYVKRTLEDKTVLAEGLIGSTFKDGNYYKIPLPYLVSSSGAYSDGINNVLQFISPDLLFNKDFYYSEGDYIRLEGLFEYSSSMHTFDEDLGGDAFDSEYNLMVFTKYSKYENLSASLIYTLENLYYADPIPNIKDGITSIDVGKPYRFLNWVDMTTNTTQVYKHFGSGGSKGILTTSVDITLPLYASTYYIQYKRPRVAQYGGNTHNARKRNTYIPCSPIYDSSTNTAVAYGDTYVTMLDYVQATWFQDAQIGEKIFSANYFPVASTHNCWLRTTPGIRSRVKDANYWLLSEDVGVTKEFELDSTTYTFTLEAELYAYNKTYDRVSDVYTYYARPDDFKELSNEDTLTKYSDTKIPKDYIDAWLSFRTLNSNVVESKYGEINKLEVYNDQLVFFQDRAIGIWYANNRELVATNNPGALTLGVGDILQQYNYITKESGTRHQFSVVNTGTALYYYDVINQGFYKFSGEGQLNTTKILGLSTLFKNIMLEGYSDNLITSSTLGVLAAYNKEFNEVILTVSGVPKNSNERTMYYTVVLSELGNKFYTFYTIKPKLLYQFNNILVGTDELTGLYTHDSGTYGELYGTTFDSSITLLVNPRTQESTKAFMFTAHNFMSSCTLNGTNVESTIATLQCSNSYQETDVVDYEANPDMLVKRARLYRVDIPRENNPEESRLVDTYLKSTLTFNNQNNYLYTLYDVETIILPVSL